MLLFHLELQEKSNIYHEVHDPILSAWFPGESKSVDISFTRDIVMTLISSAISGNLVKNSA
jgi:hypothetical protein